MQNRSVPTGTIVPDLKYPQDAGSIADWLVRTFGFEERFREGESHAQVTFGNGGCLISGRRDIDTSQANVSILVKVSDVDAHHRHALKHGAEVIDAPRTHEYGERQYVAKDPGGHHWVFSQTVADVDPRNLGCVFPEGENS